MDELVARIDTGTLDDSLDELLATFVSVISRHL
jgi:hypothetical protein